MVVEKTGFLLIHRKVLMHPLPYIALLKQQKQMESTYKHICIVYCYTCLMSTGEIIRKNWSI